MSNEKKRPRDKVYRVKQPCSPGYEGKWCRASYHSGGVSFFYFDTKEEASRGMAEKNANY